MARGGLSQAALARLRDVVAPGGRVLRVRPLRGGISSSVHLVHLVGEGGRRRAVIVRRYGAYAQEHDPGAVEREFKLLDRLAREGQPVPTPLLLDAEGGPFGAPTIVMTRVAGHPQVAPDGLSDYLRQMAEALVRLHAAPVVDLGFLPDQRALVARALRPELAPSDDALQVAVWQAAQRLWPEVRARQERHALVHGDYWPGNMLWNRRRLVGIVDWEEPRLGEPTQDVATCRGDLSILFGLEATDRFLDAYLGAGGSVRQLKFWDLLIATWAVRDIEDWATVYPVLGRPELTLAIARARIRAFAQAALQT